MRSCLMNLIILNSWYLINRRNFLKERQGTGREDNGHTCSRGQVHDHESHSSVDCHPRDLHLPGAGRWGSCTLRCSQPLGQSSLKTGSSHIVSEHDWSRVEKNWKHVSIYTYTLTQRHTHKDTDTLTYRPTYTPTHVHACIHKVGANNSHIVNYKRGREKQKYREIKEVQGYGYIYKEDAGEWKKDGR